MFYARLKTWTPGDITVEITEADVIADLDSWFLADSERDLPQDSAK